MAAGLLFFVASPSGICDPAVLEPMQREALIGGDYLGLNSDLHCPAPGAAEGRLLER